MLQKYQKKYQAFQKSSYNEKKQVIQEMLDITKLYDTYFMELSETFKQEDIPEQAMNVLYENFLKTIIETIQEQQERDIERLSSITENLSKNRKEELLEQQEL
jgi:hypothetical protein